MTAPTPKPSPEPRWKALSTEERIETVRKHSAMGMTEREINAATGAANGAVRVICNHHGFSLTTERDRRAQESVGDHEGVDINALRRRIAERASQGARRTLREQFGGRT